MGNHEYCEDCGENNFHLGRPCNPAKVAARLKERQEAHDRKTEAVKIMMQTLKSAKIPFRLDVYQKAIIDPFDFVK